MKLTFGPGVLVAAAFIGPGTVTACTLAGANFGYALVWALAFATVSTIILQDMAARLGVGARLGLGEALLQSAPNPIVKWLIVGLVFAALAIGNAAYESGNLAGGALGLQAMLGDASPDRRLLVGLLATLALLLVLVGRYALLERVLIALVLVMCAAFVLGAIIIQPNLGQIFASLIPRIPDGGTLTAIALIGTTIVPYNLFLHAATAKRKWTSSVQIGQARTESGLSIGLGGLVSILILSTAAASLFGTNASINNAADMASAIEPAFGEAARYLIGIGLFAAGLTSAITAPLATAYAVTELSGRTSETERGRVFKAVAVSIILIGAGLNMLGIKPVQLILIAQYANGLLLPIIAAFLLYVMNRKSLLGAHTNSFLMNILGFAIVALTLLLGARSILRALGIAF